MKPQVYIHYPNDAMYEMDTDVLECILRTFMNNTPQGLFYSDAHNLMKHLKMPSALFEYSKKP